MNKVLNFFKLNIVVLKWTVEYFVCLGLILWFLFHFNVFSHYHWWKFFHATFHGFGGLVFIVLMYSAIPIYIATALITYRKKEPVFKITAPDKIKSFFEKIKHIFEKQTPVAPDSEPEPIPSPEPEKTDEFPSDMPHELYIPYTRAKQNIPLTSAKSTYNKISTPAPDVTPKPKAPENESFPIPSDFDISDSLPDVQPEFNDEFPVFKDIDFDTPIEQSEPELLNSVTKYFDEHDIEYETYHEFVATEKYLIYDHNDADFWIMDNETWFAQKKQRESPIPEMLELAKQNGLIPVLYLESQNIMDLPGTTDKFESMGVRVIKSLDELK